MSVLKVRQDRQEEYKWNILNVLMQRMYGVFSHTNSVNSVIIPFHVNVVIVSHQCQQVDVCLVEIFKCTLNIFIKVECKSTDGTVYMEGRVKCTGM